MPILLRLLAAVALLCTAAASAAAPAERGGTLVVIAHAGVEHVDVNTLQRLYTGRAIEVAGKPVTVVNLAAGSPLREAFIVQLLGQDEEQYVAYWTVRRHVGKGVPPRELKSAAEVIEFVQSTPGGLGYISAGDLRQGLNVVLRP